MSYATIPTVQAPDDTFETPTQPMNAEVKEQWLKALRSGDYQQGSNRLNRDGGFCCLGVLCDLHAKKHRIDWIDGQECQMYLNESVYLPTRVASWAGMGKFGCIAKPDGHVVDLAALNDSGRTFNEIADVIEELL